LKRPTLSVVIPVYNSSEHLEKCLQKLSTSDDSPDEVIVVDDGSTDASPDVAGRFQVRLLKTETRSGPAVARNLGAREATGDVLYFIDADVLVRSDTVRQIRAAFADDPKLDALIGSYDDSPDSGDFLSLYKNLMHHFVHQQSRREACTFWSGCGAIRRSVFLDHGGFDESYDRPAIEDIELGYRLFQAERKMILDPAIQVKHLKKWTFWGLLKTDVLDRGIPWTELILRDRRMPNDLNLQLSQRVSVALAFLLVALAMAGTLYYRGYFLTPLVALLFLALGRFWGEAVSLRESRRGLIWTALIASAITAMSLAHDMEGMILPLWLGYGLLLVHHRYEYENERRKRYVRQMSALVLAVVVALTLIYLPGNFLLYGVLLVLVALVVLNTQFYLFLAARQNRTFALAAVPFHLLYLFYSGISFVAGMTRFYLFRSAPRAAERPGGRPSAQ
jgi:glycosyltransferase involved in cell wall biosynthesis